MQVVPFSIGATLKQGFSSEHACEISSADGENREPVVLQELDSTADMGPRLRSDESIENTEVVEEKSYR